MEKILSIIVPTKNRYTYLKGLVRIFKEYNSKNTELIIHDNSEDNAGFTAYLETLDCVNLRYYYTSEPLSVVDNMDRAVSHATGKYLCILGDDDLYSRYLEKYVMYMDKRGIESAIFSYETVYFWPGMEFVAHPLPSLMIQKFYNKTRRVSPEKERNKCIRLGAMDMGYLPRSYHGVIKRSLMQEIYDKVGTFFPGASPDMANSIALSYYVTNHCHCDLPLVVSGKSPKSVGGKEGHHPAGELKSVRHLPKNTEDTWPPSLPKFWSAGTIWAQSLFEAAIRLGHEDDLKKFNYASCYANVAVFESSYRDKLKPFLKGRYLLTIKFTIECFKLFALRCKVFIKNFALSRLHLTSMHIHNHVKDSLEASKIIDDYVKSVIELEK